MPTRDLIVVGSSTGGAEALCVFVAPPDHVLPAVKRGAPMRGEGATA